MAVTVSVEVRLCRSGCGSGLEVQIEKPPSHPTNYRHVHAGAYMRIWELHTYAGDPRAGLLRHRAEHTLEVNIDIACKVFDLRRGGG